MFEKAKKVEDESVSSILKNLIQLAIPTVLEEMMSTLLQYVDTAMVGRLGATATASVSVTTTVTWLLYCFPGAFSVAALAMISTAVGKGDNEEIKKISKQLSMIVIYMGVIVGAVSVLLSPLIPKWMGAEESIRKTAGLYFAIICAPMVFRCASRIYGAAIRGTKDTKTPMIINMIANVLNVVLNYLLIYTFSLGVTGAAIATAISYTIGGILMYFAFERNKTVRFNGHKDAISFKADKKIVRKMFDIAIPVMGTSLASCAGYIAFASLVTRMGTIVFAAHSIAVNAETIFYIPGYGLRTATSTLIGISIGERKQRKFDIVSELSIVVTVIMMCLSGVVLYFTAYPLMCFFTNNEEVARIGAEMLRLVAFSEPFFGLMIVSEGIFYGMGKTSYPFFVETFCMWGVRILATFICVRIMNMGLREVWYCMIADNVSKAILLTIPLAFKKNRSVATNTL